MEPAKTNKGTSTVSALRISIGLNVLLLILAAWRSWHEPRATVGREARPAAVRVDSAAGEPLVREGSRPKTGGGAKLTPAAVAELEGMGISRDILVSVLLEDLNRRTTKRLLELQKKYAPRAVPDRELRELSRQSDEQQARELKEALGEAGYVAWDKEQVLHALNRARPPGDEMPMTDAEAEQAYRLQKEFDEKTRDLQMASEDGVADKADAGTLQAQAQQALDAGLAKLLGKERLAQLRGQVDPSTEVYRTFGDLNPTPGQVGAVVQAQADYRAREAALVQQLNQGPADSAKLAAELKALSDARDESLRKIFGANAYDQLKRQNDPTYQTLQQYAGTWNLNASEVQQVYSSVRDFQDQAERLRSLQRLNEQAGQKVDWEAVNASIEQARQQMQAGLQTAIGPERFRRLQQNGVVE